MTGSRPPSLGAFLDQLGRRLDDLGPAGVRAAVERRAQTVRPSERDEFLALFDPVDDAPAVSALDEEIERFARQVAHLPPASRWGWRHRWDDEDDEYYDDTARVESRLADDLLVAIGEHFLAGEVTWAASAYERVFAVVRSTIDDDRGLDLAVDRALGSEARNRLVWAVVATAPGPGEAAPRMVAALEAAEFSADAATLDDLLAARPGSDPIADNVLRAFADALVADDDGTVLDTRRRLHLALEIRTRLDGVDAVIDDARTGGPRRLATYQWLVDHLTDTGQLERAAELGEEALAAERSSYDVASLADDVAALWRRLDRPERVLGAQCRSWESRPTVACLERVLDAVEATGAEGVPSTVLDHPAGARFLQVAVGLLAGTIDEAVSPPLPTRGKSHDRYAADRLAIAAACQIAVGGAPRPQVNATIDGACRQGEIAGWFDLRRRPPEPAATLLADRIITALSGPCRPTLLASSMPAPWSTASPSACSAPRTAPPTKWWRRWWSSWRSPPLTSTAPTPPS